MSKDYIKEITGRRLDRIREEYIKTKSVKQTLKNCSCGISIFRKAAGDLVPPTTTPIVVIKNHVATKYKSITDASDDNPGFSKQLISYYINQKSKPAKVINTGREKYVFLKFSEYEKYKEDK